MDEEEIGIQIQGSSLLLIEREDDVNIRLHNVVHDIVEQLVKDQMQSVEHVRVVCFALEACSQYIDDQIPEIFQTEDSVSLSHIVPHLKTLSVEIKNISFSVDKSGFTKITIQDLNSFLDHFEILGRACSLHSDYRSAMVLFNAALKLIKDNTTTRTRFDHSDVTYIYHWLGVIHKAIGDHDQAKKYYERALSVQLNKLGPHHVDVAKTYHNMGNLHHHLSDHQQAKQYYERALSIRLNKLGSDHVNVASTYHNMGNLHHDLGDYRQAKEYYERALSIRLNKLGSDHVHDARTYHVLGNLLNDLGDHQQAM